MWRSQHHKYKCEPLCVCTYNWIWYLKRFESLVSASDFALASLVDRPRERTCRLQEAISIECNRVHKRYKHTTLSPKNLSAMFRYAAKESDRELITRNHHVMCSFYLMFRSHRHHHRWWIHIAIYSQCHGCFHPSFSCTLLYIYSTVVVFSQFLLYCYYNAYGICRESVMCMWRN